jgi:hypothetical protein
MVDGGVGSARGGGVERGGTCVVTMVISGVGCQGGTDSTSSGRS